MTPAHVARRLRWTLCSLAGLVMLAMVTQADARQRLGLFGTVHGKPFKGKNNGAADDSCVNGIYKPADQILVLGALECRGAGRRRHPKRNFKAINLACGRLDPAQPTSPPYEMVCSAATYAEWKTGRFNSPVSSQTWLSQFSIPPGSFVPTSSVRLRLEAFDGTTVRAKLFGTFSVPQAPATGEAAISGELDLVVPMRVQ